MRQHRIDVTIWSPYSQSCNYVKPGTAAHTAESRKLARYGADVLPIAFETCGRMGTTSQLALDFLRQEAFLWGFGFGSDLGQQYIH